MLTSLDDLHNCSPMLQVLTTHFDTRSSKFWSEQRQVVLRMFPQIVEGRAETKHDN